MANAFANNAAGEREDVATYRLEVKNKGGHSSLPVPDNAIYRLAEALVRISKFKFPVETNRSNASLPGADGQGFPTNSRGANEAGAQGPRQRWKHWRPAGRIERYLADHLRGHHAGRRPCCERAAADRRRNGQLPRPAGYEARGSNRKLRQVIGDDQVSVKPLGEIVSGPPRRFVRIFSKLHRGSPTRCGRGRLPCL